MWESDLKGPELLLALAIADHADSDGRCFPGIEHLGLKTKLKKRQVQQLIHRLASKKVISIESGNGRGHKAIFQFQKVQDNAPFSEPEKVQDSTPFRDAEKVQENAPFEDDKRCAIVHVKGAQSCTEKVQDPARRYINHSFEPSIESKKADPVLEIFEEWRKVLNHPKAQLDTKRRSRIEARLKHFSVDQLKLVPHGVLRSSWHMGENPTGTLYHDISTVYQDADKVERFLTLANAPASRNGSSKPFFDPGRSAAADAEPVIAPQIAEPLPPRPAAKVPIEQTHAWNAFRDALAKHLSTDVYASWIKPLIFDGINAKNSTFRVRTRPIAHEWITKFYSEAIHDALGTIGMPEFSIEWEVEPEAYEEIQSV